MNKSKLILVDAVDCFVSDTGEINRTIHELLEGYSNKKIIVTNAPDEMITVFGLDKVPYEVFSMKKDPMKTDPKYFDIFLKQKGLSIDEVVYFEHDQKAVDAAQSLGIATYFYDSEKADLIALKVFLDKELE